MASAGWRQIFRQAPRIAVLLQLVHYVIGNTIAFFLRQPLPQATNELSSAAQCEGDSKAQHMSACAHGSRVVGQFECGGDKAAQDDAVCNSRQNYGFCLGQTHG